VYIYHPEVYPEVHYQHPEVYPEVHYQHLPVSLFIVSELKRGPFASLFPVVLYGKEPFCLPFPRGFVRKEALLPPSSPCFREERNPFASPFSVF